jgi:hypothetical protein
MFYSLESGIDSLAAVLPEEADSLDKLKSQLREILARAVSNGAAFTGSLEDQTGGIRSGPQEPLL